MYDPLSTVGKILSRGSQGSTKGKARGTSEASKGDNFSKGMLPRRIKSAVQHDAINWVARKLSQRKIVATSGKTLPAIVTNMNNS